MVKDVGASRPGLQPPLALPEGEHPVSAPASVKSSPPLDQAETRRTEMLTSIGRLAEPTPVVSPLPIVSFISATLDEDFLRFLPPGEKRSVLGGIKDAIAGSFAKIRNLAQYFSAKSTLNRAIHDAAAALEKSSPEEPRPLDVREKQLLRALFEGPLSAAVIAAGLEPPTDLPGLSKALENKKVKAALVALRAEKCGDKKEAELDVKASLEVAQAVLGTLSEHFIVGVADKSILDGDRVRPEKLAQLPAPLRIVLLDPELQKSAISAIARGEVLSAQVMKKTPEHMLEDLRDVSRTLSGGSYLWVDEFLATKKRPHISGGDVRRAKASLAAAADGLLKLADKGVQKIADAIPEAGRRDFLDCLALAPGKATAEALRALAGSFVGPVGHDLLRLAKAHDAVEELRSVDPEALLRTAEHKLDAFDAERKQAVRVRVHGASAGARGLEGKLKRHETLEKYRQEVVEHTVGAQYASEASEAAKDIVFGVAALSMLGIPLEKHLGASVMSAVLSTAEDVLGWVGEATTLSGQGMSWKDIILGWRNLGLLPTLALAMGLAAHAEKLAEVGKGFEAGGMLAVGATALTIYTSLSTAVLFREVGLEMATEGKLPGAHDRELGRAATKAAARRATDALHGPEAPVPPALGHTLEQAFQALENKLQGTPDGYALARAIAEQDPKLKTEVLDAIAKGYDDALGLLRSGADPKASIDGLAKTLAQKFIESSKELGQPGSAKDALALERQVRLALEGLGGAEVTPAKLAEVSGQVLTSVMSASQGGSLNEAQKALIEQAKRDLAQDAEMMQAELRSKLKPELKRVATRFAIDQVLANPVRRQLIEAVGIGIGISVGVGALFPALLKLPLTVAVLGSMESVITAIRLKINEGKHRRALGEIGERLVPAAAIEAKDQRLPGLV
ncbi:MAG: hypothetical protein U1E65_06140 [Myxococcota bacterium]